MILTKDAVDQAAGELRDGGSEDWRVKVLTHDSEGAPTTPSPALVETCAMTALRSPKLKTIAPEAAALARLTAWFKRRGMRPAPFQSTLWKAYAAGENGLLHAPTGSGKTLALWGGPLLGLLAADKAPRGLRVLWITPLRALAGDTLENLRAPVNDLGLSVEVAMRTGDSSSSERAKQRRKPPFALVTTPESLSLMLSDESAQAAMSEVEAVIVDEWHELLGNKRGVQLQLCLARLRRLCPHLRVWGASATLSNLDQALAVLMGTATMGTLIRAEAIKIVQVESALPANIERFPWAGHLGLRQLAQVLKAVLGASNTLVFTNTRSQAELWFEALSSVWPLDEDLLAIHHGSIDRTSRQAIEQRLRAGHLRCVVATSSLDLGVDFPCVDRIVQIGSPKGIGRLVQRAGRAGHRPGEVSRILMVPTHALEIVEILAARRALAHGVMEAREPLRLTLDVLAQHLVTLAIGGGFTRAEALAEVRTTDAFRDLDEVDFDKVIDLIVRGGASLANYPDYRRVIETEGVFRVTDRRTAMLHRWSIGTIVADGQLHVRYLKGAMLGSIEEAFLTRLAPGDRFLFAGRTLELVRIRDMVAYVRRSSSRAGAVPQWMGGKMPLSSQLADQVLAVLDQPIGIDPELLVLQPLLTLQRKLSALPRRGELLIERLRSREGHHLALYPFAGRHVHEGLAPLLAHRIGRRSPSSFSYAVNDYGLMLSSRKPILIQPDDWMGLFSTDELDADLAASLNLAELARRQFREIARIAGLTFGGLPGRMRTLRQLQASSSLLFDVLREHDPGHVLLAQAQCQALEQQLDRTRLQDCLQRSQRARLVELHPRSLTPLAFPLWAERFRGKLSHEDWQTRMRAIAEQLERGQRA